MMSLPRRCRVLSWLLLLWIAVAVVVPLRGATVRLAEGEPVQGRVTVSDGRVTITPSEGEGGGAEGEPRTLAMEDVEAIELSAADGGAGSGGDGDVALIEHDGFHPATAKSGSVKLRKGLHRIVLPYWQHLGAYGLALEWSGPEVDRQPVPPQVMRHVMPKAGETEPVGGGFDKEGFRLPENPEKVRSRLRYALMIPPEGKALAWGGLEVFKSLKVLRRGTTDTIQHTLSDRQVDFGLVIAGYVDVPRDGEYTFYLTSDDGAALYFGQTPRLYAGAFDDALKGDSPAAAAKVNLWTLDLRGGGRLVGALASFDDATVKVSLPLGEGKGDEGGLTLDVPVRRVAAMWRGDVGMGAKSPVARGEEAADVDTVYVTAEAAAAPGGEGAGDANTPVQRSVSGQVMGIGEGSLLFEYRGDTRKINLDRVLGVVLNAGTGGAAAGMGDTEQGKLYQTLHLTGGQTIPGHLVWLGAASDEGEAATVRFEPLWDGELTVAREHVEAVRVRNGRLVRLVTLEPAAVEHVPFFDLAMPPRFNEALDGGPLRMSDNSQPARGIAVHSKTALHYRLHGTFTRLRGGLGLLREGTSLGDIEARIVGDGKVLWSRESLTAGDGVVPVEVDVTGVDRLELVVDFGAGQHVGDRAAWVDPVLLRPSAKE